MDARELRGVAAREDRSPTMRATGEVGDLSTTADPEAAMLRRDLRLIDAVAIGLGAIIGAGIFVVTGVAARVAGPAFIAGLLIAGVAAACNALSSAQLAAAYPESGGTYEYGYRVLSPRLGFAAGWLFLVSKLAAGGTVALGFGAAVGALWPDMSGRAAAVAATVGLTAANYFGIKKAGRLNTAVVGVSVSVLVLFVVTGAPAFKASNLSPFAPAGIRGVLEAAALLFFAYTGYARVATLGEEVHDPRKTIPRAIVIALAISFVLYVAVSLVAVGSIGAEAMGRSASPLQAAAGVFPTKGMARIVGVGAMTAMLGVLLSQVFGISRMIFAMARRRDLPRPLEHIHPKHGVPERAVLLAGAIIVVVALVGTLKWVVAAATFTILVYYSITNLAALRMPIENKLYPSWIAVLGLAFCLLLAGSQRPITIASGLALLAVGFGLRMALRRSQASQSGADGGA
jgi:basic amino acid/polyamine antiporter, APA family